jgi:ABC-type anion transport system duplicated permease subunit
VKITFGALLLACSGRRAAGRALCAVAHVERALLPFAITLQVTPIVAIAPLILIYVESTTAALLICAWIVAFFPILSNTVIGLRAADANLRDLFTLYRASPWQRLRLLLVPTSLPYFIAGLKISGGLALIGAVVAEIRRRCGRTRDGAGLPHPGGELSAPTPAHVRCPGARRAHRRGDLRVVQPAVNLASRALAREREALNGTPR